MFGIDSTSRSESCRARRLPGRRAAARPARPRTTFKVEDIKRTHLQLLIRVIIVDFRASVLELRNKRGPGRDGTPFCLRWGVRRTAWLSARLGEARGAGEANRTSDIATSRQHEADHTDVKRAAGLHLNLYGFNVRKWGLAIVASFQDHVVPAVAYL